VTGRAIELNNGVRGSVERVPKQTPVRFVDRTETFRGRSLRVPGELAWQQMKAMIEFQSPRVAPVEASKVGMSRP
jgi:hypothetical protein